MYWKRALGSQETAAGWSRDFDEASMGLWTIEGYDSFAKEAYALPGSYSSQRVAEKAALRRLKALEMMQPSEISGGQNGMQDQIYIRRPDGTSYRFVPPQPVRPSPLFRLAYALGWGRP